MNRLIAEQILLPTGWHKNVLLEWDREGCITRVTPCSGKADEAVEGISQAAGVVVPGMPNLHSHAFQRAMAGLAEYRSDSGDSFWSWRTLMYDFARKMTPEALQTIALQLYIEMLKAGYTSVCEFHYLHHDVNDQPFANPTENLECCIAAAEAAGIGLTLLPVMYQHGGFGSQPPHATQARFLNSPEWITDVLCRLQRLHPQNAALRYGVAPHSLRAVSPASLAELLGWLRQWDADAPIHIHIAEQIKEVEDCLAWCGERPVEWLLGHFDVDAHWCLIHATHMTISELQSLARSGAVAGICPTTEANLGDGVFNGSAYVAAGGRWGIGSDSHISISLREELRLFEYSQRLLQRQRNVLAAAGGSSVGAYLYVQAVRGGALASGRPVAGLAVGQRADLLVLDTMHPDLYGKEDDQLLDSLIFCNHASSPIKHVMTGGHWVVRDGHHAGEKAGMSAYAEVLKDLFRPTSDL